MKRGKKGSRSNKTNFFSFFFCSLFSTIVLSNLRAIRFFSTEGRGCLSSQRDRGARVAIRNPGKCCSIVSYNGSSPREHSDTVAIAPVRGLQGKSQPPSPGQILLRKQTRVSVILSTANHRPICISRDARYFIDPFRA